MVFMPSLAIADTVYVDRGGRPSVGGKGQENVGGERNRELMLNSPWCAFKA